MTNPGVAGWGFIGCYVDSVQSRTFPYGAAVQGGAQNMSTLNCVNACKLHPQRSIAKAVSKSDSQVINKAISMLAPSTLENATAAILCQLRQHLMASAVVL